MSDAILMDMTRKLQEYERRIERLEAVEKATLLGNITLTGNLTMAAGKIVKTDHIAEVTGAHGIVLDNSITATSNLTVGGLFFKELISTDVIANGGTVTSALVLGNAWMILVTVEMLDGGAAPVGLGMWLVTKYTGNLVTAVVAIANVTITVNGTFNIVLTNNTGSGKYFSINMIRLS